METRSSINVEYRSAPLTPEAMAATRITITPFRHQLPVDIVGGSSKRDAAARTLTLHYGPRTTEADLPTDSRTGKPRAFLRNRGEFTRRIMEDAQVGDVVIFEQISIYEYRLHLERPDGTRISGDTRVTQESERIRRWALRETRPEQQKFRREIAERDGLKCAITGCAIAEILDAAHLDPRAPGGSDDPANGMILRADIHRLFDAGLLSIDAAGSVSISVAVTDIEYLRLQGEAASTGADLSNLAACSVAMAGA